jgi:DnaK suppressor protein
MTQAELEIVKESLIKRRSELVEELERLSSAEIGDGGSQDEGDQAAQSTLESLRNSLQQSEYNELLMIDEALKDIESGVYGICKDCDGLISEKRLKYYPNARRCLICQEASEDY